jgi:hypothetical protein
LLRWRKRFYAIEALARFGSALRGGQGASARFYISISIFKESSAGRLCASQAAQGACASHSIPIKYGLIKRERHSVASQLARLIAIFRRVRELLSSLATSDAHFSNPGRVSHQHKTVKGRGQIAKSRILSVASLQPSLSF